MARRTRGPLKRVAAFWDASALVPLCVNQGITSQVMELYGIHKIVVWWTSRVEIASALARLVRMHQLSTVDYAKARKLARDLADSWSEIQPSDAIRTRASLLVDRYDLRASDSLQLAAALEWCENAPMRRILLTADNRLREAALLCGFDTSKL